MASGFDLQSALQAIQSQTLTLHSISFHLSSLTSGCYQETPGNSLTVNIRKDDLPFFSRFLDSLGDVPRSLESLEFDRVVWEPPQVRALMGLLEGGSGGGGGVRRVAFRRNRFGPEGLARFCECLERNDAVREVVLSECGVGAGGAGLLAGALKFNECVEELQIWEDSIGSRGAEDLSRMIEVNSTLKKLSNFDLSIATAAPLISAVLARNRAIEVHVWSRESRERTSKVVEFVPESGMLQIHRLDVPGTCRVTCALGMNLTVHTLDLTGVRLKSRWAKEFRWVLEQNQTLRSVNLSKTKLKDKGVVYIAAGLFKNQRLQSLYLDGNWFGGVGVEHLLCPLCRFSSLQIQANITLKSLTFGGGRTKIGRDGLAAIVQFLMTNESVTHLGILDDEILRPEGFVKIFKSLERNASLRYLSFKGCRGVKGEVLLQTIIETLQINPWLESLDLEGTPLHSSGKTDIINNRLGRNERTEPEPDLMKEMPLVMPTTCRVFLCGQEYAGKSTLCQSISQNFFSLRAQYMDQVKTMVQPVEQAVRPVGMKISTLKDEDTKISMWNLAGHHDLFALHDLMFPGSGGATVFLVVVSFFRKPSGREEKTSEEVEEDIQHWLRFIVSNSRHAEQQCLLPNVTVVLTNYDKVTQSSENLSQIANTIQTIRDRFQGIVEFCPTVFTVDARSSASVSKLMHHLRRMSKTVLQRVPRVYQVCNDVVQILLDWRAENGNQPAMRWKEFTDLCQIKIPSLRIRSRNDGREKVETRRRAVASCLHQMGEVIYFAEVGCLILDEWFCVDMLGQLTRLDGRKYSSSTSNGFISRKDMEKILWGSFQGQIPGMGSKVLDYLDTEDVIRLMLRFELCYEQDPASQNSPLLLPSLLEDGRTKPQRWLLSSQDYVYAGRHLKYDDSSHVFLGSGFFRCLQVNLHNRIAKMKNQHGATYSLEKYLILINVNGIYIRVELGGQPGYYIDVLACSTKNVTETLRLVLSLVVSEIQSLCQGIGLNENIMRPECVRNLTPPRYRKAQFISLQQLKQALLSVPAESMYDYQHTWDPVSDNGRPVLGAGFDFARDLLSDDDFREVLHRRYHDLHNLANELHFPTVNDSDDPGSSLFASGEIDGRVDPSFGGIAKGVEAVLQRLKIIEQEIRDLKQEIQGLRYFEHRLLLELHRKVNYLVNYNVQVEERKVPNMFYFIRTENYSRRLVTNVISGMTALRLHMLCEYRREMHVVEDQMGCEMMHIDNRAVQCLAPYMTKFVKLLTFALKIGAHLAVGMGQLIPDLSRVLAHLADASVMTGSAGAFAAGAAGVAAMSQVRSMNGDRQRDIQQDHKAAQQWVVDFLRDRGCSTGKDITEKFGLYRVRYRDDGQIAWICKRHMHVRANEIIEVPM